MRLSTLSRQASIFVFTAAVVTACGGEVGDDLSPSPPATVDGVDASDPRVLPPGIYEIGPIAASCDVNARMQSQIRGADPPASFFLVRKGSGVNIPMPIRLADDEDTNGWLAGRQDLDLAVSKRESTAENDPRCPSGKVHHVIEITKLTNTSVSVRHVEEMIGCAPERLPSCTVDFDLTLKIAACKDPDDATCTEESAIHFGTGARVDVKCVCNNR